MNLPGDTLRRPKTAAPLDRIDERTLAPGTDTRYRIVLGIPDLRLFDPPYIAREAALPEVGRIVEAAAVMDDESGLRHFVFGIEQSTGWHGGGERRLQRLPSPAGRAFARICDQHGAVARK